MTMRLPPPARLLLLALGASACSTWHAQTAPVREVVAAPLPRTRVTLRDGSRLQLWSARVERDSIVGHLTDDTTRTAFAVVDVAALETWEPDAVETVKWTAVVVLGVALAVIRIGIAASSP